MYRSIAAILVLSLGMSAVAIGQQERRPYTRERVRERQMRRVDTIVERLNLTEEQQKQWQGLRIKHQKKQIQHQSSVQLVRLELQELTLGDNLDKNAIKKKMKEISDLQYQGKLDMVDHLFEMRSVLTPEQQALWKGHMLRGMGGSRGGFRGGAGRMHGSWGEASPEPIQDLGFLEEEIFYEDETSQP
jgi:Spy/CpxP family protein refolding chaperone